MMKHDSRVQRGQALVIVAVGMVALIALTALAIDGGNAYSDRRHAQNAADTSVMAAGLTKIRNAATCSSSSDPVLCTVAQTGVGRAAENGYTTNGSTTVLNVYQCSDLAASCALPPSEPFTDDNPANGFHDAAESYTDTNGNGKYDMVDPKQFIQVTITSVIPTYLALIVGITALTYTVQAIARAVPPSPLPWYSGRALVATMPGCSGWPHDPFTLGGNSATLVTAPAVCSSIPRATTPSQ